MKQALPTYGTGLVASLPSEWFFDSLVFCAPEPWETVRRQFPQPPRAAVVPESMEQRLLEKQIDALPMADTVFGIGGGSACDAAKMYAHRRGTRLVLVPTVLSVDAPFTKAVGVRVNHCVRYVGEVFPERLLVDFDILCQSPKRLNRAGIGDVLSIFTALPDWRLGRDFRAEAYDEGIAGESQRLLDDLFAGAADIRECNERGLKLIAELYVGEVALCERMGNSRPEEGSEHYFAYALEAVTHKSYIHGELIAFSVLLAALYQEQNVERVLDFLRLVDVAYLPEQIGVSWDEVEQALLGLPDFLGHEPQLLYGVFHHKGMDRSAAGELRERFRAAVKK